MKKVFKNVEEVVRFCDFEIRRCRFEVEELKVKYSNKEIDKKEYSNRRRKLIERIKECTVTANGIEIGFFKVEDIKL